MKVTAVIMAGGRGERFWPKSRGNYPKQFLRLWSERETAWDNCHGSWARNVRLCRLP